MRGHIAIAFGWLAGCSGLADTTTGELGHIDFDVSPANTDPGDACFISCGLDRALLVGTSERIGTQPTGDEVMPLLTAASSAPDIIAVEGRAKTCCNNACYDGDRYEECLAEGHEVRYELSATVTALRPGTAKLVVFRPDGSVYDRVAIRAARASSLEIQVGDRHDNRRTVGDELALTGQHEQIRVIARDDDGEWMFASAGISMELSQNGVAAFYGEEMSIDRSYAELWPLARGTDMLTVTAAGATKRIPITSE